MYSSNILQIIAFVSHKRVIYTAQGTDCLPEKQKEMPSKSDSASVRSVIKYVCGTGAIQPAKTGRTKTHCLSTEQAPAAADLSQAASA